MRIKFYNHILMEDYPQYENLKEVSIEATYDKIFYPHPYVLRVNGNNYSYEFEDERNQDLNDLSALINKKEFKSGGLIESFIQRRTLKQMFQ